MSYSPTPGHASPRPAGLPPRPADWFERCYVLSFSAEGALSWEALAGFARGRPAENDDTTQEATS
jgi:hypothetical protein